MDEQLIAAVESGDIQRVRELLEAGANPNAKKGDNTAYQLVPHGRDDIKCALIHRDGYKCQNSNCKGKSEVLQIHHIGYWKTQPDRSNRPGNLITLCEKCHVPANHEKGKFLFGWEPKVKSFKAETFMSTIYQKLLGILNAEQTYGYETKYNREQLELPA